MIFPRPRTCVIVVILALLSVSVPAQQALPDALELFRSGNYTRAVEVTLLEIEAQPRRVDSYVVLGWSLLALGRNAQALAYAEEALRFNRTDQRLLNIAAEAALAEGRPLVALGHLETYVALWPDGAYIADSHALVAEILEGFGELRNADTALSAALAYRQEVEWWVGLGEIREELGQYARALDAFDAALALNPNSAAALDGRRRALAAGAAP